LQSGAAEHLGKTVGGGVERAVADALDRAGGIRIDEDRRFRVRLAGGPVAEVRSGHPLGLARKSVTAPLV